VSSIGDVRVCVNIRSGVCCIYAVGGLLATIKYRRQLETTREKESSVLSLSKMSSLERQGAEIKCEYCGKQFSRSWTLKRHIDSIHSRQELHRSDIKEKKKRNLNQTIDRLWIKNHGKVADLVPSSDENRNEQTTEPTVPAVKKPRRNNYRELNGQEPTDPFLCPSRQELLDFGYPEGGLQEIADHWNMIRSKNRRSKVLSQYNKRLKVGQLDVHEIREFVMQVHKQHVSQYKLQVTFLRT
jgi:hypothetical protein